VIDEVYHYRSGSDEGGRGDQRATSARGQNDAFVAKLNPTGGALFYSSFLGGSANDDGYGIVVDGLGDAYIAGVTR